MTGIGRAKRAVPAARAVSAAIGLTVLLGATPACSSGNGPGAASADQQSLAEYDLAKDAFQNGRLREALEHAQKAIDLDEDNADAAYLGAVILLAFCAIDERSTDCRYGEAERHVRRALEASPDMREAKNTLGVILVHQRRYDEAIAVLKPLANDILYGSPEKSWGNLGWAYLLAGKIDEAIDALRRALAAQPLFCVGQYRLGLAFEKKNELAAASDALTKALETPRPECQKLQDAFDARARVRMRLGETELARDDLARCRDLSPKTVVGQRCATQLEQMP